jgi:hypothetical protein
MWYLVTGHEVVGRVAIERDVYASVLHYIRQRTNAAPSLVMDFDSIFNPNGVYYVKKAGVYTVRVYTLLEGMLYNSYDYEEFTIYISRYDENQKSALKLSYLEAVKKEHLLKPILVKSPNA